MRWTLRGVYIPAAKDSTFFPHGDNAKNQIPQNLKPFVRAFESKSTNNTIYPPKSVEKDRKLCLHIDDTAV